MHPITNVLPRLFPVLLVLGAAVLIAQLVADDDESEGGEGGTGTAGEPQPASGR